jgi:CRP/FNR family transcriptional regulator
MAASLALIREYLPQLGEDLSKKIAEKAEFITIPKGSEILKEGQYIKVIPIVVKGTLKVFSRYDDKEFLLYFIQQSESCVLSFSAFMENETSKVFAVAEEETTLLAIPSDRLNSWLNEHPVLHKLFYHQYHQRYGELIRMIEQLIFLRLEDRLLEYLKERSRLQSNGLVTLSHREIAGDLGTAREVVSRLLRKLEKEHRIELKELGIAMV